MRCRRDTLKALWWLTLVLVGVPVGLLHLPGRPTLPRHLPSHAQWAQFLQQPLTPHAATTGVAVLGWTLWAILLCAAARDLLRRAATLVRRFPRVRLPGPLQSLSATVLGAVAVSSTATGTAHAAAHSRPAPANTDPSPLLAFAAFPTGAHAPAQATSTVAAPGTAAPAVSLVVRVGEQRPTCTVRRGDTLWHIAAQRLGDPQRWPEIYQLNRDRFDQHGRMRHGDHIEPGWVLALPGDATPPAAAIPDPPPAPPAAPQTQTPAPPPPSAATTPPTTRTPPAGPAAAPTSHAPAPSRPSDSSLRPAGPRSPRTSPPGITLPGGSWLDLGLATAVAATATAVWIQRRRRYRPRPPESGVRLDDPDLAPMPPVVTQVRRGLRRTAQHPCVTVASDRVPAAGALRHEDEWPNLPRHDDVDDAIPDRDPDDIGEFEVDSDTHSPGPGTSATAQQRSLACSPVGLGLTGPGAPAAARGFLAAALAADTLDEPEARTRVVVPAGTLASLLGADATPAGNSPRLTVTAGLAEALDLLEAATLHRTRLAYDHEVDTVAALREADPMDEPLPPLLLIADATAIHHQARVASLLTQGQRLDIHGVLLGDWADGNTVHVDSVGAISRIDTADGSAGRHGPHPADIGRLAVSDPTQTGDLLRVLAEAHTGQPQPAPTVEAVPAAAEPVDRTASTRDGAATGTPAAEGDQARNDKKAVSTWPGRSDRQDPAVAIDASATDDAGASAAPEEDQARLPDTDLTAARDPSVDPTGVQTVDDLGRTSTGEPDDAGTAAAPADLDPAAPGPRLPADPRQADGSTPQPRPDPAGTRAVPSAEYVRVPIRVLGRPALVTVGPPKQEPRKRALELLVYLVVHRRGANLPDIKEAFWPDASNRRAGERLQTETGDLRSRVRDAYRAANPTTENDENTREQPQPVVNTGGRYHLNPDLLDVDWWNVQDALAAATTDTAHRIAHLRRAVDAFGGPLADGCGYDWLPDVAEHVRRQGIIAHTRLAALVADTDPAEAAGLLDQATALDPINEQLARAAMQAHAHLGNADAVRAALQRLRTALDEIDVEPDEATTSFATDLLRQITGGSGPRRPPHELP